MNQQTEAEKTLAENKKRRYYFINRPPSIGTHPQGETGRKAFAYRETIPGTERLSHGWVEYPQPLDFEQVWRYELYPADEAEADRYYDWRNEVGK